MSRPATRDCTERFHVLRAAFRERDREQGKGPPLPPGEGACASAAASSSATVASDERARLHAFYAEHNPSKLGQVDANLRKYKGREAEMWRALYHKYGVKDPDCDGAVGARSDVGAQSSSEAGSTVADAGVAGGRGGGGGSRVTPAATQQLYDALGDTGMHVQDMITMVDTKMEVLQQLYTQRVMNGFDESANADVDAQISALTASVKSGFKMGEGFLHGIHVVQGTAKGQVARNMRKQLALQMQERLTRFRKMQKEYLDKLDDTPMKQAAAEVQQGLDESSEAAQELQAIDQMLLNETDTIEQLAKEREAEIAKIVQSMQEINAMFKDLAELVADQGDMVERIDAQMDEASLRAKSGLEEVRQAAKHQQKCIVS